MTAVVSSPAGASASGGPSAVCSGFNGVGGDGYVIAGSDGSAYGFGTQQVGSGNVLPATGFHFDSPVVAVNPNVQTTAAEPLGYTLATSGGGYYGIDTSKNTVTVFPSMVGQPLRAPIVGAVRYFDTGGYYLVAADGGVFAFGGAPYLGSMGGQHLNAPIVGMGISTGPPTNPYGYYLVAADGGVFAFGGAAFFGSMGGQRLNAPIVGVATPVHSGFIASGYWLVASDGGVFSFGQAKFFGSTGNIHLNKPIVGMAFGTDSGGSADPNVNQGYWLVAQDGGVFSFGNTAYCGSAASISPKAPIVGMAATFTVPETM